MNPSIETLEDVVWPEPEFKSSLLVTAHALRKKPLDVLTANDLRVAFNEDIGTKFLTKRVIEVLTENPTAGELYDGDLICAVLRSREFNRDQIFREKVKRLASLVLEYDLDDDTRQEIEEARNA